jgi:hypothetical protein
MTSDEKTPEEILDEVVGVFFGKPRKRTRAKPHRCLRCGRVTRFVFCPECHKLRSEERAKEER